MLLYKPIVSFACLCVFHTHSRLFSISSLFEVRAFFFNPCSLPETIVNLKNYLGFPGGAVVENPPAGVGDTGLSPGPERSHMPRSG